jgi:hypothetical protein
LEFDELPKDHAIRAAAYCDHAYARQGDRMLANSKTGHDLRQRLNADFHSAPSRAAPSNGLFGSSRSRRLPTHAAGPSSTP